MVNLGMVYVLFFKPTLAVSDVFVVALVAHERMEATAS